MRTRPPAVVSRSDRPPAQPPKKTLTDWVAPGFILAAVAAVVLASFLAVYPRKGFTVPIGWDQSEYLWRTTLTQEVGVANIDRPLPSAADPKTGRPAFPVIAATVSSLSGASPFRVAMVLPSVMAVAIGLAAGAFVAGVLRRPTWELVVVALMVSFSSSVVRLMTPEAYMDAMFAAAVFLVASIPVALSPESPRAVVTATVLLASGAVIHWSFFAFIAVTVILVGATLLPTSWRLWRRGQTRILDTPTARLGMGLMGGAALGGFTTLAILSNGFPSARVDVSEFAKKLDRDLPRYRFFATVPVAAVGLVPLAQQSRGDAPLARRSRFVLTFLLAWCVVVLAGYLARTALDLPVPAHRFLSFGLAVPMLGALAVVWIGRLLARVGRPLVVIGVAVAVGGAASLSLVQWYRTRPQTDVRKIEGAAAALPYLEAAGVALQRPIVFIIEPRDGNAAALMSHTIRASLPAERIQHLYVFVGSPEAYLAHRPVDTDISRIYFRRVEPAYSQDPVALIASPFNPTEYSRWVAAHPDTEIDPVIAVVQGPGVPSDLASTGPTLGPPTGPIRVWELGALAVAALGVLTLTGLGWTVALIGRWLRPAETLAAAPAVGVGILVVGGILIDQGGFRLAGLAGALTPVVLAIAGWALAVGLRARHRGTPTAD